MTMLYKYGFASTAWIPTNDKLRDVKVLGGMGDGIEGCPNPPNILSDYMI